MTEPAARRATGHTWPVLSWLPGYQRSWLRFDLVAGLTVCGILVPEGMAYAQLAGVPPEYAFYAAPIGLLAYALLGSSRQLVVAVSSAVAIMSAATISELATAGSAEYVALTAALAMLAGLVSIAAGVLRLGRIAQFFSESVLVGFVFGLALLITVKQIPKLLGIEAHGDTAIALIRDMLPHLSETDLLTLAVGAGGIAGMIVLERLLPRVPAALLVLLGSIAASAAFGLEARGVAVVGELPAGLAGPSLPGVGLDAVPQLLGRRARHRPGRLRRGDRAGRGVRARARREDRPEPRAGGPRRREHGRRPLLGVPHRVVALEVGGQRPRRGQDAGLADHGGRGDRPGGPVPDAAVRAAPGGDARSHRRRRGRGDDEGRQDEAALAAASHGLLAGRRSLWWASSSCRPCRRWRIAVVVSLGMLVWRASQARLTFLGRARGGLEQVDLRTAPDAAIPGLLIVRPDEMLFFANVASVSDEIVAAVAEADPRPSVVLLDLGLTPEADVPVVEALEHLQGRLSGDGIELWLSHLRPGTRDLLDRAGALAAIGPERVYARVIDGIVAFALRTPGAAERVTVLNDLLAFIRERAARPDESAEGSSCWPPWRSDSRWS